MKRIAFFAVAASLAACAGMSTRNAEVGELQCQDLPALVGSYLALHIVHTTLDEGLRQRFAAGVIRSLDPLQTALSGNKAGDLREQLALALNDSNRMCNALFEVRAVLTAAWANESKSLQAILAKPIAPPVKGATNPMREAAYHPEPPDLRRRLGQVVAWQAASLRLLGASPAVIANDLRRAHARKIARLDEKGLINVAAHAIADAFDPESAFYSVAELKDAAKANGGGAPAIRVSDAYGSLRIAFVGDGVAGSENLRVGDTLLAFSDLYAPPTSFVARDIGSANHLLTGAIGSSVDFVVLRKKRMVAVRVKRGPLVEAARVSVSYPKKGVAVIKLPSFYKPPGERSASEDFRAALVDAKAKGVSGIVIDLSNNYGGDVDEILKTAGQMIGSDLVGYACDRFSILALRTNPDPRACFDGRVVLLVTQGTSSGGELFAGILQNSARAFLVGQRTAGQGTKAGLAEVRDKNFAVKISTVAFFLRDGRSAQGHGIQPDLVLMPPFAHEPLPNEIVLNSVDPEKMQTSREPAVACGLAWADQVRPELTAKAARRIRGKDFSSPGERVAEAVSVLEDWAGLVESTP